MAGMAQPHFSSDVAHAPVRNRTETTSVALMMRRNMATASYEGELQVRCIICPSYGMAVGAVNIPFPTPTPPGHVFALAGAGRSEAS
jgi:hypothetical protein